jgi:hypothetical protein
MSGARGLVRLILLHGAPVEFLTRRAVRDEAHPEPNRNLYSGFGEDVKDAKAWKRWIENGHIGGLPEEIARMIMLMNWENWCA